MQLPDILSIKQPNSSQSVSGKVTSLMGNEVLFSLFELGDFKQITEAKYAQINTFIVVTDVVREETLQYAGRALSFIKQNRSQPYILLAANKIDRLGSRYNMGAVFANHIQSATEHSCNLLPVTVKMNKTNLRNSLLLTLLRGNNPYSSLNRLGSSANTYVFDDHLPVRKEDFLLVSQPNKNQEPIKKYCVVKGEFFIQQLQQEITVIFLTVCIAKPVKSDKCKFRLLVPGGEEFLFTTDSPESVKDWVQICLIPISGQEIYRPLELNPDYDHTHSSESLSFKENSFAGVLNIINRASCVDCGKERACEFVSRQYGVFLCKDCATCHSRILGRKISKVLSIEEANSIPSFWTHSYVEFNEHFNSLWEASLQTNSATTGIQHKLAAFEKIEKIEKIQASSSMKDREEYIQCKYLSRQFFSHGTEPLFLQPNNPLLPWQPRYFQISDQGQIGIYQDNQFKQFVESFNLSWCSFRSGKDLNLSSEYIQFINPSRVDLYRAKNEISAAKWLITLQLGLARAKRLQYANAIPACIPSRSSEDIPFGLAELSELFIEKNRLANLVSRKNERMAQKENLEAQLQAILSELLSLSERETLCQTAISKLEPPQVKRILNELITLMDENEHRLGDGPTPGKPRTPSPPRNANKFGSRVRLANVKKTAPASPPAQTIHPQIQLLDEGLLIFSEKDDGLIRGGHLHCLVELLTNATYSQTEPEYQEYFFRSYPSFAKANEVFGLLSNIFALPATKSKMKLVSSSNSRGYSVSNPSEGSAVRAKVLEILEFWSGTYWDSDFFLDQLLTASLISFLEFVAQTVLSLGTRANEIRAGIMEKFNVVRDKQPGIVQDTLFSPRGGKNFESEVVSSLAPQLVNKDHMALLSADELKLLGSLSRQTGSNPDHLTDILLDSDSVDVAKQLCIQDLEFLAKIHPRELLNKRWMSDERENIAPNVVSFTERFNRLSQWVSTCVVQKSKQRTRVKVIEWFIGLAGKCKEFNNFHSVIAIMGGLRAPAVVRLKRTWESINPKVQSVFNDLENLISVEDNWGCYRKTVTGCLSGGDPCMPYIGVYLKDLVSIEDGFPNFLPDHDNLINMDKRRKIAAIIGEIQAFQRRPYNFQFQALPNVCLQLANSSLIPLLNEEELYELSKQLEPKKNSVPKLKK